MPGNDEQPLGETKKEKDRKTSEVEEAAELPLASFTILHTEHDPLLLFLRIWLHVGSVTFANSLLDHAIIYANQVWTHVLRNTGHVRY